MAETPTRSLFESRPRREACAARCWSPCSRCSGKRNPGPKRPRTQASTECSLCRPCAPPRSCPTERHWGKTPRRNASSSSPTRGCRRSPKRPPRSRLRPCVLRCCWAETRSKSSPTSFPTKPRWATMYPGWTQIAVLSRRREASSPGRHVAGPALDSVPAPRQPIPTVPRKFAFHATCPRFVPFSLHPRPTQEENSPKKQNWSVRYPRRESGTPTSDTCSVQTPIQTDA